MPMDPTVTGAAMSVLDAVNRMLQAIGQRNVATLLTADRNADVEAAINILGEVSREVQSEGWHFNTYRNHLINPSVDDEIILPLNCMRVDHVDGVHGKDYVHRGRRLWDAEENTFTITTAVRVNFIGLLPWDDLFQEARWYITVKATRRFATDRTAAQGVYQFTSLDESKAEARFKSADAQNADHELKRTNPHFRRMGRR